MTQIRFKEGIWRISRQPPVAAGARAEGDRIPQVPESGLWFHLDTGEALFFPMTYSELPSEEQLADIPLSRIAEMMAEARRGREPSKSS